jgi:hypothetical protein
MRWRSKPSHTLVLKKDVRRLTGIDADEVLLLSGTQGLVRVSDKGAREELVRLPLTLLIGYDDSLPEGESQPPPRRSGPAK